MNQAAQRRRDALCWHCSGAHLALGTVGIGEALGAPNVESFGVGGVRRNSDVSRGQILQRDHAELLLQRVGAGEVVELTGVVQYEPACDVTDLMSRTYVTYCDACNG